MGLFSRRTLQAPAGGIVASGERLNLRDRETVNAIAARKASWQAQAWDYRDLVGELGKAQRIVSNIISKVAFVGGQFKEGDDEPVLITSDQCDLPERVRTAVADALGRLPFRSGYGFQGKLSACFNFAGEGWLYGTARDGKETWKALSDAEVVSGSGGLAVVTTPGKPPTVIDPDRDALLRLWVPHPRFSELADSPMRTLLDTCEDIVLIGRELRAASRSRIASNGLLLISDAMTLERNPEAPDGENNDFQSTLEAAMLAPIGNEGHAGAVVPIVLRGNPEDLKAVRHISLAREDSPTLIAKQEAALGRLADGLDLPSDMLKGMGDVNHWTGWLIDATAFRNHIEPGVRLLADSITEAYLLPTLVMPLADGGYGLTEDEVADVVTWYDAGLVTENANRAQDAKDAWDRGAIGNDTLRSALGFNEGDAPDPDELRQMLAFKGAGPDQSTMAQLLSGLLGTRIEPAAPVVVQGGRVPAGELPAGSGNASRSEPATGARRVESGPTGSAPTAPPGLTAASGGRGAAHPQKVLDSEGVKYRLVIGDQLAEIDRALRERIVTAADDALMRALERAGNRIKSKAQHTQHAASLAELDAFAVGPALGELAIAELGLTEDILLAAAFTYLGVKFAQWTTAAIRQSVKAVAGLFALPLTAVANLVKVMTARIPAAWAKLEDSLRRRALERLYGKGGDAAAPGELPDTVVKPGMVREALAEVGGAAPGPATGGVATGADIADAVRGRATELGFIWKYGITARERSFHPHEVLADLRLTWDDERLDPGDNASWIGPRYRPGDHDGCLCDQIPVWAVEDTRDLITDTVGTETPAMHADRVLAGLDDAAGRSGTTSQRTRAERDRILTAQRTWLRGA